MPPDIPRVTLALFVCLTACSPEPRVIAARRDLPAGTQLMIGDIVDVKRPDAPLNTIAVRQSAAILGAYLKVPVASGEPLPADCCTREGAHDGGSSNGMRQRRLAISRRATSCAGRRRPPCR